MILPNVVSFVGQLDSHAPYLTVKETFDFAFQCRTGGTHSNLGVSNLGAITNLDKENFTENLTIEGLDLAHVCDTFVGNDDVRGVSGGQRRRVTVGEMMQGQNPVACGDEISTGLDAAVTYDIVHSIVVFSKKAMTTRIISLLQPGPETVSLFDEVVLLAEGQLVYAGPVEEVVDYFECLGYKQVRMNYSYLPLCMFYVHQAHPLSLPKSRQQSTSRIIYSPFLPLTESSSSALNPVHQITITLHQSLLMLSKAASNTSASLRSWKTGPTQISGSPNTRLFPHKRMKRLMTTITRKEFQSSSKLCIKIPSSGRCN